MKGMGWAQTLYDLLCWRPTAGREKQPEVPEFVLRSCKKCGCAIPHHGCPGYPPQISTEGDCPPECSPRKPCFCHAGVWPND